MPVTRCSLSALRSALNHLYDPRALRSSPLVKMVEAGGRSSPQARLRRALTQAIESLKPGDDVPDQSPAWRVYEILHYRYVQQCGQEEVAHQLGLSVRHLKREQRKALEVLAERLHQEFGVEIALDPEGGREQGPTDDEVPLAGGELQWLEDLAPTKPVELKMMLPTVQGLIQSITARYKVRLRVEHSEPIPPLAVHTVALRQILLSLLCVAIRQAAGAQLLIVDRPRHWDVEIEIRSESPKAQPRLTSEDEANLAMARRLAKACGGTLTLPGGRGGFIATLLLPAAGQLSVLVIDDNLDVQRLLQRYAAGTRYRVLGAQHPEQAFALVRRKPPEMIILDVMMPEVDGWELLGRLKQHPLTSDIPVIALTILAQEELAFSLGVSGFLRKPVNRRDFLAALDRMLLSLESRRHSMR